MNSIYSGADNSEDFFEEILEENQTDNFKVTLREIIDDPTLHAHHIGVLVWKIIWEKAKNEFPNAKETNKEIKIILPSLGPQDYQKIKFGKFKYPTEKSTMSFRVLKEIF